MMPFCGLRASITWTALRYPYQSSGRSSARGVGAAGGKAARRGGGLKAIISQRIDCNLGILLAIVKRVEIVCNDVAMTCRRLAMATQYLATDH